MDPFDPCLAFTLAQEGGFSDDALDPGGATMHGLIMSDLLHWDRDATVADLKAMPDDLVAAIYRALYWQPIRGASLWPGLDLAMFDHAVNCGVGTATKILQRLLHVTPDGGLGPVTASAARAVPLANRAAFLGNVAAAQSAAYRALRLFPTFGRGWIARSERRAAAAVALLA